MRPKMLMVTHVILHYFRRQLPVFLALPPSLVLFACTPDSTGTPPFGPVGGTAAPSVGAISEADLHGTDDVFSWLAERVPGGFGGAYLDGDNLVVFLKDLSRAEDAKAAIVSLQRSDLSPKQRYSETDIMVRLGTYDFRELREWATKADAVLALPETSYLDIDETDNRVRIGLYDMSAESEVLRLLENVQVPLEAVLISQAPADELVVDSLSHYVRPIQGGYQTVIAGVDTAGACTITANLRTTSYEGFLTASHCTSEWGQVDNDTAYQNNRPHRVGIETFDKPFITHAQNSSCPSGEQCRWSDAAIITYDSNDVDDQGYIARTIFESPVVDNTTADWRIINDDPNCPWVSWCTLEGLELEKVGQRTGWSKGQVNKTCLKKKASHPFTGTTAVFLCQDRVADPLVEQGDSGAPVFEISGAPDIVLYGILWLKSGDRYYFSRIANVKLELGDFETIAIGGITPE